MSMSILARRGQARFIRELLGKDPSPVTGRRVIASLTTMPDRIANLAPTLDCLLQQTRPPDEIVLAVPEFSQRQQTRYTIPEYLKSYSKLRILRSEKDWGPATKFIPAIQEELAAGRGDSLIMVVDDDRIYPRDALETYLHYHRLLPDAVLCFRGAPMPNDLRWRRPQLVFADRIREPRKTAVITGCGSYFVQPRFFDAGVWDYSNAPAGAFYMDDIWISGWLDRGKIDKYMVPASAMMRTVPGQRRTMTLHDVPNGRRQSNNETIAFFRETWNVFSPRLLGRFKRRERTARVGGSR
jgi:Glycosyl transferase family 2